MKQPHGPSVGDGGSRAVVTVPATDDPAGGWPDASPMTLGRRFVRLKRGRRSSDEIAAGVDFVTDPGAVPPGEARQFRQPEALGPSYRRYPSELTRSQVWFWS